ncbi:MAG TPA: hypothetical protein VG917_05875 [Patescibacteria group bacterium]|nr:hypothetical protein [Patescibacteria group bacterium]
MAQDDMNKDQNLTTEEDESGTKGGQTTQEFEDSDIDTDMSEQDE